jgi:outer membrane protein OmpA-like peptidoglycan-associated protein
MKAQINFKKGPRIAWPPFALIIRSLILSALLLTGIQLTMQAQTDQDIKPSWWFGAAAGANFNFYHGSTQELTTDLTVPATFHDGKGVGLYLAPLVEFHRPDSRLGVMLQVGYDNRKGKFNEIITPCNCPADLSTTLSYLTIEPSLRFAPFKSNFYLYAGPRLAINMSKAFTYQLRTNPAFPDQVMGAAVKSDFSSMQTALISMQVGAGYDIPLSSQDKHTQWIISPFVSFQPYFGQSPRTIETWNVTTLRAGAAIKFGHTHKSAPAEVEQAGAAPVKTEVKVPKAVILISEVQFTINSPENIPVERRVRETFPIRNYVFFNLGSTEIPDRYVLLSKDQVKDFKEDQLEVFTPKRLSGRSAREMVVYYNVLNILGDRMGKNPTATVKLSGASMQGIEDGMAMAESIKKYLVNIFGIDPSRFILEGTIKPKIPSEQSGGTLELGLLREGDRRVSISSSSPEITMEFQSGPDAPLKPVAFNAVQEAPLDSYVTFNVSGAKDAFSSWSLEIKDQTGNIQYFGPYTEERVSLPGKVVLGNNAQGDYKVTMVGQPKTGNKIVKKEASMHMVLWTPSEREEGMRFSVIFEFNVSKAIAVYEKYLTDIVTPKIPKNGTVIIHGHTDVIGDKAENVRLSIARANDVKQIIENALSKAGRSDVKFEVYGFGPDQSPFENKYPEERFYNRTVIIDLIPPR